MSGFLLTVLPLKRTNVVTMTNDNNEKKQTINSLSWQYAFQVNMLKLQAASSKSGLFSFRM